SPMRREHGSMNIAREASTNILATVWSWSTVIVMSWWPTPSTTASDRLLHSPNEKAYYSEPFRDDWHRRHGPRTKSRCRPQDSSVHRRPTLPDRNSLA